jgi:YVTN family beta-propeller protein
MPVFDRLERAKDPKLQHAPIVTRPSCLVSPSRQPLVRAGPRFVSDLLDDGARLRHRDCHRQDCVKQTSSVKPPPEEEIEMRSSHQSKRGATLVGATLLVAVLAALLSLGTGRSAASGRPATRTAGAADRHAATLIASVPIPNDGPVAFGMGSMWVVDREHGVLFNGVPLGRLYRIDPRTLRVTDVIRNVLGGSETVSNNAVWIASFALDRLLRVNPASHSVTSIKTGPDDDPGTLNVLPVSGSIWVSNHHDGTVAVLNPSTNEVTATIPVFRTGCCGAQALATDGSSVWVAIPGADLTESAIVRINAATHTVTGSLTGIPDGPCGGMTIAGSTLWATAGNCDSQGIMLVNPATIQLAGYFHGPASPGDIAYAFGSIWIATSSPDELVRIDPATQTVVGVLPLPADPWNTNAIVPVSNRLYVRVNGALLSIAP